MADEECTRDALLIKYARLVKALIKKHRALGMRSINVQSMKSE